MAARLGIGVSDLHALERLMLDGPVGPAEISTALGIRPASATALVDRLERTGHVRREPHAFDRRRLVLVPTEKALTDGWAAVMPLVASLEAAAEGLDEDQRRAVALYLDRVIEGLRASASRERLR
jgi:DNA-binding MarR family transcriptional regulator